jgi:hypothetical protein
VIEPNNYRKSGSSAGANSVTARDFTAVVEQAANKPVAAAWVIDIRARIVQLPVSPDIVGELEARLLPCRQHP